MPFVFREDGWFNMTKAAKHYGKDLFEFFRLPSTRQYVRALIERFGDTGIFPVDSDGRVNTCVSKRGVGTWAHPKMAVYFARWLDVKFAVWCDMMIEDRRPGSPGSSRVVPHQGHCGATAGGMAGHRRGTAGWQEAPPQQAELRQVDQRERLRRHAQAGPSRRDVAR